MSWVGLIVNMDARSMFSKTAVIVEHRLSCRFCYSILYSDERNQEVGATWSQTIEDCHSQKKH